MPESPQTTAPETAEKPRRLVKILRIGAYITALLLLVLAFLPTGLRLGARYWLNQQPNLEAEIDNIDLNLFRATCALEGLRLTYKGEPTLNIERLVVGVKYLPLWNKHAFIDYVDLTGLRLVLEQVVAGDEGESGGIRIGGIMLADIFAEQEDESEDSAPETASGWNFGWNHIAIDSSEIIWRQPDWSADLIIGQARFSDVASWNPELYSDLQLHLRVNDAPLALTMQSQLFAPHPTATGHISLDGFALAKLAPILAPFGIHDVAGMLSCDLKHEVQLGANDAVSLNVKGSVALERGALTTAQIHIAEAGLNWSGTSAVTTMPHGTTEITLEGAVQIPILDAEDIGSGLALHQQGFRWRGRINSRFEVDVAPKIEVKGVLATDALTLLDRQHQRLLASWAQLKIDPFYATEQHIQLGQLDISSLVALRPSISPVETEPALAQCGTLSLTELDVELPGEKKGVRVALSALNLNGLGIELIRLASGHTNIDQWSYLDAQGEQDVEEGASTPALAWRVDTLQVGGNSYIRVTDASVTPGVTLYLNELNFSLRQLNSAEIQTRNPFSLDAKLGRFATLQAEGAMSILNPALAGSLKASLHDFPLYTIAPYAEKEMGARIEKGALDFNASATIDNNQLDLNSQADLRGFTLGAMTAEQHEQISSNLGMPLSLALALLRDRNGDIHLDIPVSGDLSSPDISIGPIIRKALLGAVQETLKLALMPLGILSGAGKLIGIGRELRLPPVLFTPAETNFTASGSALQPLAELLAKRPQLRVVLEAPLTLTDSEALHAQQTKSTQDDKKEAKELSEAQFRAQAIALLQERLYTIKQYLLDVGGVEPEQILLTQPSQALTPGEPRVEMRF